MTYMLCHPWHHDDTHVTYDTDMESMTHCPGAGKGQFWCKTMAQYGTVCNICPHHLTITYMLCHPWHHDGTHVTYGTDMESMTPSWQQWHHAVLALGKDDSVVTQWHTMAQYVICVLPTSPWRTCYVTNDTTMALMSLMTQTWNQWHNHGNNDTTLSWSWERRFWCITIAQYGTVCNICPPHLTITYMLCHPWHHDGTHVTYGTDMESMTPSWQQWHHAVLALGKDDSVVKQWHTMAQYVIYVLPTSPWRTCYVTNDTTMALMSLMTQTWNQWHHHGNNDTTLSWSWERTILVQNNGTIWHSM